MNTYGYVYQNPLYWIDPYGLCSTFGERWWKNFTETNAKILGPGTSIALAATHAITVKSVGGLTWGQALSIPRSSYVRGQAIVAAGATTAIHQAQFYGALELGIALGSLISAIEVSDGVSVSDWWADYIFEIVHDEKPDNDRPGCEKPKEDKIEECSNK